MLGVQNRETTDRRFCSSLPALFFRADVCDRIYGQTDSHTEWLPGNIVRIRLLTRKRIR